MTALERRLGLRQPGPATTRQQQSRAKAHRRQLKEQPLRWRQRQLRLSGQVGVRQGLAWVARWAKRWVSQEGFLNAAEERVLCRSHYRSVKSLSPCHTTWPPPGRRLQTFALRGCCSRLNLLLGSLMRAGKARVAAAAAAAAAKYATPGQKERMIMEAASAVRATTLVIIVALTAEGVCCDSSWTRASLKSQNAGASCGALGAAPSPLPRCPGCARFVVSLGAMNGSRLQHMRAL
jgi:hypothetical protein